MQDTVSFLKSSLGLGKTSLICPLHFLDCWCDRERAECHRLSQIELGYPLKSTNSKLVEEERKEIFKAGLSIMDLLQ